MKIEDGVPLPLAQELAGEIANWLGPHCIRVEIAGSIRRRKEFVGDIEVLCVPKVRVVEQAVLFGGAETIQRQAGLSDAMADLSSLPNWGQGGARGEKFSQLIHMGRNGNPDIAADIFACYDQRAWGSYLFVRTGPARLSIDLMAQAKALGAHFGDGFLLHAHGGKCDKGALCDWIIPLPDEQAVFDVLRLGEFVGPDKRELFNIPRASSRQLGKTRRAEAADRSQPS